MSGLNYIHAPEPSVDFNRILNAMVKSLRWIIPVVLLVTISTLAITSTMTPRFRGEAQVLIERQVTPQGDDLPEIVDPTIVDDAAVQSQVQVLGSRDLSQRVIDRLGLQELREFGGGQLGFLALITQFLPSAGDADRTSAQKVMDAYQDRLRIFSVTDSRVIVVQFWSYDPDLAADVANTILDEYLVLQADAKRALTMTTSENLEPEIAKLQRDVEAADRAVANYRAGTDLLLGPNETTISQQQLSEINTQLTAARARQAEAEAQASLIRSLLQSGGSLETAPEVLNSPLFQRLRERQVALQSQIAELRSTFLDTHPRIQAIRAQLADIDRQVRNETRNILDGIENEGRVAAARVASLTEDLNEIKASAARANEAQVQLSSLEREAEVKAAQLSTLLRQFSEAQTQRSVRDLPANARVISQAVAPNKPFSPLIFAATVIAAISTFILCMLFVILREMMATPRRDAQEGFVPGEMHPVYAGMPYVAATNENNGHQVYTSAPDFSKAPEAQHKDHREASSQSRVSQLKPADPMLSAVSSSVGDVWGAIQASKARKRRILVLALYDIALADATAITLAREASRNSSTIMVDLNSSSSASTFMVDGEHLPGFWDLLEGRSSFADIIFHDHGSSTHVIPAGRSADSERTEELEIGQEQLTAVMESLEESYQIIVANAGRAEIVEAELIASADQVILTADCAADDPELAEYFAVLMKLANGPIRVLAVTDTQAAAAVA